MTEAANVATLGELRKLLVKAIAWNTVKNIPKENGLDPGPKRGAVTWDKFLKIHTATHWQRGFFSKRVLTSVRDGECHASLRRSNDVSFVLLARRSTRI